MCVLTPPVELHVSATAGATATVREFVRRELCSHHAADADAQACVVASSLVGDALRNGGSPVTLTMECWESSLLVKVTDHVTREVREDDPRRRLGSLLIEKFGLDAGLEPGGGGRTRWCLVPVVEPAASPTRSQAEIARSG